MSIVKSLCVYCGSSHGHNPNFTRTAEALGRAREAASAHEALERASVSLVLDDMDQLVRPIRDRLGMNREFHGATAQREAGDARGAAGRIMRLLDEGTRWPNTFPLLLQDAATPKEQ